MALQRHAELLDSSPGKPWLVKAVAKCSPPHCSVLQLSMRWLGTGVRVHDLAPLLRNTRVPAHWPWLALPRQQPGEGQQPSTSSCKASLMGVLTRVGFTCVRVENSALKATNFGSGGVLNSFNFFPPKKL